MITVASLIYWSLYGFSAPMDYIRVPTRVHRDNSANRRLESEEAADAPGSLRDTLHSNLIIQRLIGSCVINDKPSRISNDWGENR